MKHIQSIGFIFGLITALVASVYLICLGPYVQAGDSGEMVVAATLLKVTHPPGYPVYVYLGHLFSYLPISTPAWRIGLFSLLAQLGATLLVFDILRRWLKDLWIAALVALFYAFSPLVWSMATQAEVFALNNFFVLSVVWLVYRYAETRQASFAYWACLASGLAFCHHQTSVFITFPLILFYLFVDRKQWVSVRKISFGLSLFVIGLLPFLLLFHAGAKSDLLSWGDFSTWDGFWLHVLRREYGTFKMASDSYLGFFAPSKFLAYAMELFRQTAGFGFLIALYALVRLVRRPVSHIEEFGLGLVFSLLFYSFLLNGLINVDPAIPLFYFITIRMWHLPLAILWLVSAYGMVTLAKVVPRTTLVSGLVALLVGATALHWSGQDLHQSQTAEQIARASLEDAAPGALLFMRGDTWVNCARYVQEFEHRRPDVHIVPLDLLSHPWTKAVVAKAIPGIVFPEDLAENVNRPEARSFVDLALINMAKFPIYLPQMNPMEEQMLAGRLEGFIVGYQTHIRTPGSHWTLEEIDQETRNFLALKPPPEKEFYAYDTYYHKSIPEFQLAIGASLALRAPQDLRFAVKAEDVFKTVAETSADQRPVALMQIAYLYTDLLAQHPEYRPRAIQAWQRYLIQHPEPSPETNQAQKILSQLTASAAP